jgi:MFS family permease
LLPVDLPSFCLAWKRKERMDTLTAARKITNTLFLAQSLGSAGLVLAATINSIVGAQLSGSAALAGAPSAIFLLGTAFASLGGGYFMERFGRRGGITVGLLCGVVGAGLAAKAVVDRSFPAFLFGLAIVGIAQAALQLGRFAAAEVHPPLERGRAISRVVLGGTVGAVFGPWLVGPVGSLALRAGYEELAGPFMAGMLLYLAAALLIFLRLRPEPRDLGRELAALYPERLPEEGGNRSIVEILRAPAPLAAMAVMVGSQMVMVMLMVITALHMTDHHHTLTSISAVISSHTFGMFAFSIISGQLADRWGRMPVILVGLGTLILACLLAPLSPQVVPLAVALFLLGLGWNFCYVGGSSLLADHLSPLERARTQGFNDLLIGLASALGSFGSGLVFAAVGYGTMGLAGILVALVPLVLVARWKLGRPRQALPQASGK